MAGSETLTVLFCDVVGSTELLAAMGDASFEVARRELVGVGEEAVATAGGRIVKWMGDGAMATFPSASDALRAAIALQHGSRRVRAGGERLRLRVGISVGDVIVDGGDCHGTAVVEAARLCGAAGPGEVLCTEVVAVLARGQRGELETEAVGALALKGLPEPVAARRLLVPEAAGNATAGGGLPAGLAVERAAPLVGREAERKRLAEVVEAARGARAVGLVAGEPGIGKSRLVAEVAASAVEAGARVVLGRCAEDLVAPLAPWAEVVAALVDAHAGELDGVIERSGSVLARVVPLVGQRSPDLAPPPPVDAATERRRFAEAVDDLVSAVAEQVPLVVVLEDLHWADEPSLAVLGHLLRPGAPAGVAVLGTYRHTDLDRRHPLAATLAALRRRPEVTRVSLSGLATAELADLVEAVAGQEPDDELVAALEEATEGNPFFAVEVLAHLAESGAYDYRDGRWVATVPVAELGLPEGVREVVGRRLSALDDTTNAALAVLAVCGAEGDAGVIAEVAGVDDALDALDDAVRAGLAREVGAGRYGFAHALVRQTLLEEQSLARRARHHWQIGQAIARRRPRALADIAHHLVEGAQAGDPGQAVDAALAAADDAVERANVQEAILAYDRALEAMDVCDLDDDERRWHALVGKGDAGAQALDTETVVDMQMAAIDLAERNGWHDRVAEALVASTVFPDYSLPHDRLVPLADRLLAQPQQPATLARLHIARSHLAWAIDLVAAREHAAAALGIARDLHDFDLFGAATTAYLNAVEGGLTADELRSVADEADQRAAAGGGASRGHWRPETAYTIPCRIVSALRDGDRDLVEACLAEGDATIVGLMRFRLSIARRGLAVADGRLDDLEALVAQADENYPRLGLQIVTGGNDRLETRMVTGDATAVAAARDGDAGAMADLLNTAVSSFEAALGVGAIDGDHLLAVLDRLDAVGVNAMLGPVASLQAELTARCGDARVATRLLTILDRLGGRYLIQGGGSRFWPRQRARAQVLGVLDRLDEAVAAAETAVVHDLDMRTPFLEAGSRRWLAWALERRAQPGDVDRAIGELRAAAAIAGRTGHTVLAGECAAELARLGAG